MEISGTGTQEDRIAALEIRVRNMDALVRGLIEESLDFKAMAMTLARQDRERSRYESAAGTVTPPTAETAGEAPSALPSELDAPGNSTIVRPREKSQPIVPAESAMVSIMQPDGTMKMEPRSGDQTIDSQRGSGQTRKMNLSRGKRPL